ncbi:Guanylate cyclase, partial [Operophtera brumata]
VAALALCCALLVALAVWRGAGRGRGVSRGGARGGGRRAVLLLPADFLFPADERRVDDGMETMLSCWLRRLHEFGGPEPAPAPHALLPQPALAPRAPSLPSSTCSVNRVAVDRRTRYKGDPVHVKYLQAAAAGAPEPRRKALDVLLAGCRHAARWCGRTAGAARWRPC